LGGEMTQAKKKKLKKKEFISLLKELVMNISWHDYHTKD
jgi:hypothetical protein